MTPEEARQQITDAIHHLEQRSTPEADAAYDFLKKVPLSYSVALDAFRQGLQSRSEDARMESAANLAKMGRRIDWVLPALQEACLRESVDHVRGRYAFEIARLQTPDAARVLIELVTKELQRKPPTFSAGAFCSALGSMGAVACKCLPQIERLITSLQEPKQPGVNNSESIGDDSGHADYVRVELRNARRKIVSAIKSAYASYQVHGADTPVERPILGKDTIELSRAGKKDKVCRVCFDQRVDFATHRPGASVFTQEGELRPESFQQPAGLHEIRCVIIEKAPNSYVCIAVWDHFSSSSLVNQFESFAKGLLTSLHVSAEQSISIEFGYFQPSSAMDPDSRYTGVKLAQDYGNLNITGWLQDSRFHELFGEHAQEIKALLSKHPVVPEDFMSHVMGQVQDEQTELRLARELHNSPEGRLDYSALVSDFCDEVKSAAETGKFEGKIALIHGDSFDPEGNEDLFARALPHDVAKILVACQRIEQSAIAQGYSDLRYLDWPTLDSLPEELIVRGTRPFELQIDEAAAQIVLDLDPRTYGVILFRVRHNEDFYRVTNIPVTAFSHSQGFNWGYRGTDPSELALNIINAFVPPGADGKSEEESGTPFWGPRKRTFISSTARQLSPGLLDEMVAELPVWGGYISAKRLKAWIVSQVAQGSRAP